MLSRQATRPPAAETSFRSPQDFGMKRVVVSAALAVCLAQPAMEAMAQTVSDQCFALGDIAGQVASWRTHKKTKAQALDQAAKYYKDNADRQAINAIIDRIYSQQGPGMTPDQASMIATADCANHQNTAPSPAQ
jgi:hypothetical protein